MKPGWLVGLLFAFLSYGVVGCQGIAGILDSNPDASSEAGSDSDGATDIDGEQESDGNQGTDADANTDSDTDTQTDNDQDTQPISTIPVFLLAGQSNMIGNVDQNLFNNLLEELDKPPADTLHTRLFEQLKDWYYNWNNGYAKYGYSENMANFEVSELIRLQNSGLVGAQLTTPYAQVLCSMNKLKVAALTTNCGNPFGPELTLGHYLGRQSITPTSLIKVGKGGTTLYADWRSPTTVAQEGGTVGEYYLTLQNRIRSLKSEPANIHPSCVTKDCQWTAFIWFQGENDCFDTDHAQTYEQNLRHFIADVRAEIGSPTLPVIVVEIGAWAQSMQFGAVVAKAQQSIEAADPNVGIVPTDDLSGFYHYDPAAQLIIGERIAKLLISMLSYPNAAEKEGSMVLY